MNCLQMNQYTRDLEDAARILLQLINTFREVPETKLVNKNDELSYMPIMNKLRKKS